MNAVAFYEDALKSLPPQFVFDVDRDRWVSGEEFRIDIEETRNKARGLIRDLCFLCIENSYDFLITFYALVLEELPVALLGSKKISEISSSLLNAYEPGYLLVNQSEAAELSGYHFEHFILDTRIYHKDLPSASNLTRSSTAILLSTSGSTGSPKFVRLTLNNLLENGLSIIDSLGLQPSDRAITVLPTSYSFGLSIVNSHILAQGSLILWRTGILGQGFWECLRTQKATSLSGVPYTFTMLKRLGFDKMELPDLRMLTQAGGKLQTNLIEEFVEIAERKAFNFFVMYGQTEATARMTCFSASSHQRKIGSVGLAIKKGSLSIELFEGKEDGEIIYSGPNVMLGYAESRADLLTADKLKGVLRTGDVGHVDEDGFLYITGRLKRIGKIAGIRISLDEVEALLKHLGQVAVVSSDEKIEIFHSCRDQDLLAQELQTLATKLKLHKTFLKLNFLEEIPVNHNGKVNYSGLKGT